MFWHCCGISDVQGTIVAAAYGVPPSWADTMQGAELWAVQMVLTSTTLLENIYTDCKTVYIGVNAFAALAGSSKMCYARKLDSAARCDHGDETSRVVW